MTRRWDCKTCILHIFGFELVYKMLLLGVVHPVISQVLNGYLSRYSATGTVFNADMFFSFASLWGILLVLLFLAVSLALVFYEYAVLIQLAELYRRKQPYAVKEVLVTAYSDLSLLKNRWFPLAYVYFVLLNPLIHTGYISSFLPVFEIPRFIPAELQRTVPGQIAVFLFYAVLFLLYLFLSFVPVFMVLEKVGWMEAVKRSFRHYKAVGARTWLKFAGLVLLLFLVNVSVERELPYRLLTSGDFNWYFVRYLVNSEHFRWSFLEYVLFSFYWVAVEFLFLWILLRSYAKEHPERELSFAETLPKTTRKAADLGKRLWSKGKEKLRKPTKRVKERVLRSKFLRRHKKLCILTACVVVYLAAVSYLNQWPLIHEPWVIGHRGDITAPENSLEGIRQADRFHADYAEIDVQLTKDGQAAVVHDPNLSRLTGVGAEVGDLTYEELSQLTVVSHGGTAQIPTLRQAIETAKACPNGIGLLIEFKPGEGQAEQLVDLVAELVEELEFTGRAIFMSMDHPSVTYLQEKHPEWWVGYCVYGSLGKLDISVGADFLAVEENQLNTRFLEDARSNDLPVYVWTTDDYNDIFNYLRLGVSGIIGDSAENVFAAVDEYRRQDHSSYLYTGSGYPKRTADGLEYRSPLPDQEEDELETEE